MKAVRKRLREYVLRVPVVLCGPEEVTDAKFFLDQSAFPHELHYGQVNQRFSGPSQIKALFGRQMLKARGNGQKIAALARRDASCLNGSDLF